MNHPPRGAAPPPLPPRSARPTADAARRRGCLIALVVAGCLLVPVVAILAAIAVPAYHDYLGRSQVGRALAAAGPLQPAVAAFVAEHRRCPVNGDPGFEPAEAYTGPAHASIVFGESDEQVCAIELLLQADRHEAVDGHRLWLEYDVAGDRWGCSAEPDDRYLPAHCRG
ncbi:pilin [Luteimonas kalidii]|uniref:Pilin n=1 Tax=Luteimonas kalidii TaxID=3042025 RepID=A0ABT6JU98_9GAMM|nr:pilin [Luteimonas kalidii]MDH5834262.1 pilin [Luteimonas kalidii]